MPYLLLLLLLAACGDDPAPGGAADPCATVSCGAHATCSRGECACDEGFVGDGQRCDPEATGCADAPCDEHAACADTATSFTCTCNAGWEGDGRTCADVDECDGSPCNAHATCTNSPGSFTCACDEGWTGDGLACTDVDECAGDPCDPNARCANTPGSFTCTCNEGWGGDGLTCSRLWSDPFTVGQPLDDPSVPYDGSLQVGADAEGNLIAVFTDGEQVVYARRYDRAADQWSELLQLSGFDDPGSTPKLAVSANGDAIVAWDLRNDWESTGIASRRFDASLGWPDGWGPSETFVSTAFEAMHVALRFVGIGTDGEALSVYTYSAYDPEKDEWSVGSRVRLHDGAAWGEYTDIPSTDDWPLVAMRAGDGEIFLAVLSTSMEHLRTMTGTWDGQAWTWGTPAAHTEAGAGWRPALAIDAGRNVHLAWCENDATVRTRRWDAATGSWNIAADLHDRPALGETLQLVAGAEGDAMLVFSETDAAGSRHGLWSRHRDGAWTTPDRIAPLGHGYIWAVGAALHEDGRCLLAWEDRVDGAADWSTWVRECDDAGDLGPALPLGSGVEDHIKPKAILSAEGGAVFWEVRQEESDPVQPITYQARIRYSP